MDPAVNEQYYLLVAAKLRETAAHVIAMSVLVLNLRKIQRALLRMLAYLLEILAQNKNWALVQWTLNSIFNNLSAKYSLTTIIITLQPVNTACLIEILCNTMAFPC